MQNRKEVYKMSKILVAYFSASGVTKKMANKLSLLANADLYEIKPEVLYSKAMRPAIIKEELDLAKYDTILLGFPIWWYVAPTIINTFLESYDFTGKRIVLFATSGGSGFGNTVNELKGSAQDAIIKEGILLNNASDKKIKEFIVNL